MRPCDLLRCSALLEARRSWVRILLAAILFFFGSCISFRGFSSVVVSFGIISQKAAHPFSLCDRVLFLLQFLLYPQLVCVQSFVFDIFCKSPLYTTNVRYVKSPAPKLQDGRFEPRRTANLDTSTKTRKLCKKEEAIQEDSLREHYKYFLGAFALRLL